MYEIVLILVAIHIVFDKNDNVILWITDLNTDIKTDFDFIWLKVIKIIRVNDHGEIIAEGETIYGEKHSMLLTPVKAN